MKERNLYWIADILLFMCAGFFAWGVKKGQSIPFFYGLYSLVAFFVFCYLEKKFHISRTKLTTKVPVYVLDEDSDDLRLVTDETFDIDGFVLNGKVYKCCTGTHVNIDKNGKVTTKNISGTLFNNILRAPVKGQDNHWNGLWEKAHIK